MLTGLINRREFEQRLERLLQSALQQGREHVLCYMDLDQFKVINDTCGHVAGDELLRQLALLLRANLRERDTLARLGGDEFALLLENCSVQDALEVVDAFRADVQRFRFKRGDRIFAVSMSVGVVVVTRDNDSAASLLSAADSACYLAKDHGRNQIHVYESRDTDLARHRGEMQWMTRIQRAIREKRLRLSWQEIRRANGVAKDERHVELLLRMLDDDSSGLSSFGYLRNLDVDSLKIDSAFVRDIATKPIDRYMVEAIHRIGRQMGLKTVDEYVESDATLAVLRQIGVDYVQGNAVHRPAPLDTLCGAAQP